jgi:prolyl-tRNA editing enzyme YbaK/EbsC (Cys-tRNA(Pro) deacylase)
VVLSTQYITKEEVMSVERVRTYLQQFNKDQDIIEFTVSTATVELAASALEVEPAQIAKTLSFWGEENIIMLVTSGDARIDNKKFKSTFNKKAKMLDKESVFTHTQYEVGGVCPFDLPESCEVFLDESLKKLSTVFPASGSASSALRTTPDELFTLSKARKWVDVTISKTDE